MQEYRTPKNPRDSTAWLKCWAEDGFVTLRLPDRRIGQVTFSRLLPPSKHRGHHGYVERPDARSFALWFSQETRIDALSFTTPTAIIPDGDPLQAWWLFPPSRGQRQPDTVVPFGKLNVT